MGFAAFMIADNGGLRGIGELAVLGISIAACHRDPRAPEHRGPPQR
jgi:hypothetical protein